MNKQAEPIIQAYENERTDAIVNQIDALRPRPFSGLISLFFGVIGLIVLQYINALDFSNQSYYLIFIVLSIVVGVIEGESRKINRRIDLLTKLVVAKGSTKHGN